MSVSRDDVIKLAELSRLKLTEEEMIRMQGEIESILKYVEAVQKVPLPSGVAASPHLSIQNVMRADEAPHDGGIFTDDIVAQFPQSQGNYLKVKKIL